MPLIRMRLIHLLAAIMVLAPATQGLIEARSAGVGVQVLATAGGLLIGVLFASAYLWSMRWGWRNGILGMGLTVVALAGGVYASLVVAQWIMIAA